ncbi:MAG: YncE family protein [Woeseiaceae bacterium]
MPSTGANLRHLFRLFILAGFLFVMCRPAFAQFDDGARYAFVGSESEKAVYIIDLYQRSKATSLAFDVTPGPVVASDLLKTLIVGHADEKKLTLVDLMSKSLNRYEYSLDIRPDLVLVSPIGETVAILDREQSVIEVHALRRKEVLVRIEDVNTESDITFNPDGSIVYWVDQDQGSLHSIDLWSQHKELKLTRDGHGLSAMSRSADGILGFISNADTGTVYVVDLLDFTVTRSSQAGRSPERPWGTADGQTMLVPNAAGGTVTAISALTGEVLYTVDAVRDPVSINPGWIDTTAAVVGRDGTVVFLNIGDGAELGRVRLDNSPAAGVVTSDSKTLAIPVPASGTMAFFDMRKRARMSSVGQLPSDIGPAALAISNNLCH